METIVLISVYLLSILFCRWSFKKISLDGSKIYSKWQDVFKENNNDIVFYKLPRDRVLFFYNKT